MKKVFAAAVVLPVLVALLAVLFALWADRHVGQAAAGRMFDTLDDLPKRDVALVLGTSKYANGRLNSFYTARIRAAAELYQSGKVDGILVSGDNGRDDYNEPAQMKADLVALGVPAEHITSDYAGFRTLELDLSGRRCVWAAVVYDCFAGIPRRTSAVSGGSETSRRCRLSGLQPTGLLGQTGQGPRGARARKGCIGRRSASQRTEVLGTPCHRQ